MENNIDKVCGHLLTAIRAERDGAHFYLMAAQTCEDPKGKEVFQQLAGEEVDHQRFLYAQYKALQETGHTDQGTKLKRKLDLMDESPIFSLKIKDRLNQAHFEMTALSIGIQLELSAMNFYKEAAAEAEDPQVNALFEELSDWESGHYHALLRQQELLIDDYRLNSSFSPF